MRVRTLNDKLIRRMHERKLGHPRYPHLADAVRLALNYCVYGKRRRAVLDVGSSVGELLRQLPAMNKLSQAEN